MPVINARYNVTRVMKQHVYKFQNKNGNKRFFLKKKKLFINIALNMVYLNNYVSFCLFFNLIFGYSFFEVESFVPIERRGHSAISVGNKLYFFGGVNVKHNPLSELFYLDLSKPFNAAAPSWNDISVSSTIPLGSAWAAVTLTNNNNNPNIYIIGGLMKNQSNEDSLDSLVYTFNPNSEQWDIPTIVGKEPKRRRNIQAVTDDFGKIYVFGGVIDSETGSEINQYFNDMIILNTNDLTWSYGPIINAPSRRYGYTATLLSDGTIIYIGGYELTVDNIEREVDINQISLYDTKLESWSVVVCIYNYYYKRLCEILTIYNNRSF